MFGPQFVGTNQTKNFGSVNEMWLAAIVPVLYTHTHTPF
jgi:hypothetical protein